VQQISHHPFSVLAVGMLPVQAVSEGGRMKKMWGAASLGILCGSLCAERTALDPHFSLREGHDHPTQHSLHGADCLCPFADGHHIHLPVQKPARKARFLASRIPLAFSLLAYTACGFVNISAFKYQRLRHIFSSGRQGIHLNHCA
jgi:hypothetical protein